ncbi:MAG: DUF58 domain-containing protein [Oligoflexia bacterium]|nr:DUF58 domain-containing protein [Oligoflexia bacterium]
MSGQYKSHFKGQGMQFSEHRLYVEGDDIRHIDWKVSARSRDPMIKKYEEERELTVFLVVDVSKSGDFGSAGKLKAEAAAEIGGMLAYAAMHSGDKVGALLFAGDVELIIPPQKGQKHVLRIIREILSHRSTSSGTNLRGALDAAGRIMKHSGVVFVISDFIAKGYESALNRLGRRHDLIAISIADQREREIPDVGQILLADPETGEERLVDTGSYAFKKWHKEWVAVQDAQTLQALRAGNVESLRISTQEDYAEAVIRFFRIRAKRRKR